MDPVSIFTTDEERTFEHQGTLPSLPIPTLEHTMNKYLDSVRPHVTEEEFKVTQSVVRKFQDGVGKELHERLMARAHHQRNWIETWWEEKVYLELRVPTAPLVNIAGPAPFQRIWSAKEGTQIERAALWIYYIVDYWEHLRKERLRPDRNAKGRVLSMSQYHRTFNTCKIPGVKKDRICCHFKTESAGDCPSHVVVLCKGRIFSFDTFHPTGSRLTFPEIEKQLIHIRAVCDSSPEGAGVGSLTGDNRTSWAQTRNHLISSHPDNWSHLKRIESAVVAVCLDETSPQNDSEVQYFAMAGDSMNRWFDKSYTLIVYKNGLTAAQCDHAPFEGIILVSSLNYVSLALQQCSGQWMGSTVVRSLQKPTELDFRLEDAVVNAIQKARAVNRTLNDSIETYLDQFPNYGKSFLRGVGLHPDTHVQLALQYAYYKTYRRPAPTYETATTRQFYNGRTETVRSCTLEALTWSKAMQDPAASTQKRHRLYIVAANKHNQLMAEAQDNQGCDRHLFGLQCMAEEEGIPLPEIYTDLAYTKSGGGGHFILSTSFLGYSPVCGCVAPMCEDGYCVAYSIENNKINTAISSWTNDKNTDSLRFTATLKECLCEMGELVRSKDRAARL